MANREAKMWAAQGNSQETEEERRTGNVEISSGCEVRFVPHTLALFSRTRVRSDQKENNLALSRYIRDCRQNWNNSLDYCFSAWFWDVRTSPN